MNIFSKVAAAFTLPKNRKNDTALNYPNVTPPFGMNPPQGTIGDFADLEKRALNDDPRDIYWLALPNKLTPQQCLQIMRSALGGDLFQQNALLHVMLDTWPTFRMASHQLREAAAYAKYTVTPYSEEGEEPSEEAKAKAGLISRAIKGMEPNPFNDEKGFTGMVYDFSDALLNGISLSELVWEQRNTAKHGMEMMPKAAAWIHPRHFTFSNNGNIALFDDTYQRLYSDPKLTNQGKMGQAPDPNKFICSQFVSRSGSVLGAGMMRPLVWYWAARQFNNEWMLNTAKQYGSPFIEITFKSGTPASELAQLDTMLKNAGPERRLRHPEGTTATIHPPTSLGTDNPQRYIAEEADKQCLFLLLGQSGTTMPTAGALGNQDAHKEVAEEKVVGVAKWIAHNPLRQLARAILRVNYGDATECPTIEPDFTHPLNATETVAFANGLTNSRLPFRADEAYKKLGMSQPEKGDVVVQGGEVKIMGDALTDEDKFDQQQEHQQKVAEAQGQGQDDGQGNGDEPTQARGGINQPLKIAGLKPVKHLDLTRATDSELAELETLVLAAEAAPHPNGELTALNRKLLELSTR